MVRSSRNSSDLNSTERTSPAATAAATPSFTSKLIRMSRYSIVSASTRDALQNVALFDTQAAAPFSSRWHDSFARIQEVEDRLVSDFEDSSTDSGFEQPLHGQSEFPHELTEAGGGPQWVESRFN